MRSPRKAISPVSLRKVPVMQLTSVLLPEPLGPSRPTRSPVATWKSTPSSATKPPKCLLILVAVRMLSATGLLLPSAQGEESDQPVRCQGDEQNEQDTHDQQVELRRDRHRHHLFQRADDHSTDQRPEP